MFSSSLSNNFPSSRTDMRIDRNLKVCPDGPEKVRQSILVFAHSYNQFTTIYDATLDL